MSMVIAAQHIIGERLVVSDHTAATLWSGAGMLPVHAPQLHFTLVPSPGKWHQLTCPESGWSIRRHFRHLAPGEIRTIDGVPLTSKMRTLRDLAPQYEFDEAVCLFDAAFRERWVSPEGLTAVVHSSNSNAMATARRAAEWAREGAQSVLETRWRLLLIREGLAPDVLQYEVQFEGGRYFGDMAWIGPYGVLVLECDGVGVHGGPEAVFADRTRQNALIAAGISVLRVTWRDLYNPERVLAAIRQGLVRIGAAAAA